MVDFKEIDSPIHKEISLKEIIIEIKDWAGYLFSKWLIILLFGLVGGLIGFTVALVKKPIYKATLTFALEDDKQSSGGIAGAMNLASSLGIDLGTSAGGAFSGGNLMELMKSRTLVTKALLNSILVNGKQLSLADYFIKIYDLKNGWEKDPKLMSLSYPLPSSSINYTLQQDSIIGIIYMAIAGEKGLLSVFQKDKKISIINVEVKSIDQLFSQVFTESLAKEVSDFYVESKSKKARTNVAILQKQVDSVRAELNTAIMGVASSNDNTFNLNPAQNVKRTPSTKKQIDVQANTAILTQLITNLELAKVTLLKETPLIQVIDRPILPLQKEKLSKSKAVVIGGILAGVFISMCLLGRRLYFRLMNDQ